jgi:hypothetical protein
MFHNKMVPEGEKNKKKNKNIREALADLSAGRATETAISPRRTVRATSFCIILITVNTGKGAVVELRMELEVEMQNYGKLLRTGLKVNDRYARNVQYYKCYT